MGANCHESPTTYDEYIDGIMRCIDEAERRHMEASLKQRKETDDESIPRTNEAGAS